LVALGQRRHEHVLGRRGLEEVVDLELRALEDEARRDQLLGCGAPCTHQRFVHARAHLVQARQVAVDVLLGAHRVRVGHEVDHAILHTAELREHEVVVFERLVRDHVVQRPAHDGCRDLLGRIQWGILEAVEALEAFAGQRHGFLAVRGGQRRQFTIQARLLGAAEVLGRRGRLWRQAHPVFGEAVGPDVECGVRFARAGLRDGRWRGCCRQGHPGKHGGNRAAMRARVLRWRVNGMSWASL
jgi:hypothetical protein